MKSMRGTLVRIELRRHCEEHSEYKSRQTSISSGLPPICHFDQATQLRAEKSLEFTVLYGQKRYKTILKKYFLEISPLCSPRFRSVRFGRNDSFGVQQTICHLRRGRRPLRPVLLYPRHCEERSDEAIRDLLGFFRIASVASYLAMTMGKPSAKSL